MDDRIVNGRGRAWALSLALSGVLAAPFSGAQQPADYDELPDGPAASVSAERTRQYIERLAESPLARAAPGAVRQACAQFGLMDGVCEAHRGYVRRALVVEEMLVQGQLSLDALEIELIGATRPKLSGGSAAH